MATQKQPNDALMTLLVHYGVPKELIEAVSSYIKK
jgi:hypothetical protein